MAKVSNEFTNVKNILFDFDGTLFYSKDIIFYAYKNAVFHFNKMIANDLITAPNQNQINALIGIPSPDVIKKLFPNLQNDYREILASMVRNQIKILISSKKGYLFEGVVETISYLYKKGYFLFIASNSFSVYTSKILTNYSLLDFFYPIIGLDNKTIKNKKNILYAYKTMYKLLGNNSVMIGDRYIDLDSARYTKFQFIACNYGYANENEFPKNIKSINKISELLNYF